MKLDETDFAVFDVETTGLYPYSGDRICEIAAVRVGSDLKRPKRFSTLVDPKKSLSPGAFSVNGITDEMLAGKPTIDKVLPEFLDFIKGSVLVAYNAGFDLGFLESSLGHNKDILKNYYVIDALGLARRLFPEAGRYNLGKLSSHLGISSPSEHRALADVVMTLKVFRKELKLLKKEGVVTVEEIAYAKTTRPSSVKKVKDYKTKLIEEAIRQEKKLNIVYRSAWYDTVTRRTVTPKEIQEGYDKSYLVAYCHLRNEERNFRLDCILDAEIDA